METIDKVMQCLEWLDFENNNPDSGNYDERLSPVQNTPNQIIYYDIDENECVLNFDGESIEFEGKVYTFEEFLDLLTGGDEDYLEIMLDEIDLD